MDGRFQVFDHAAALPDAWDLLLQKNEKCLDVDNLYLSKAFLSFLETVNPCDQRYYLSLADQALFVSYKLKLDLLNFSHIGSLRTKVSVVGVPLSVSGAGFSASGQAGRDAITSWLRSNGLGLTVVLNVPAGEVFSLPKGRTLSSYMLPLKFESFEDYRAQLRSPYRRQALRALDAFKGVTVSEIMASEAFDKTLYQLYLEVYERSNDKLEKLEIGYFKNFPGRTFCVYHEGIAIAFIQTLDHFASEGVVRHFVLGGFNGAYIEQVDLYRNLLLFLIRSAIEEGCCAVELGQTAAESKSKTGAIEQPKDLYILHSNRLVDWALRHLVKNFSYKRYEVKHNVFKRSGTKAN